MASRTRRGAGTGRPGPSWWLMGVGGRSPFSVNWAVVSSSFVSSSSLSSKGFGGEEERGVSSVSPPTSFVVSKESAFSGVTAGTEMTSLGGSFESFIAGEVAFVWSLSDGEV